MEDKNTNDENSTTVKTDVNTVLCAVGNVIGFRYKGNRFVKGEILEIDNKGLLLKLKANYIGKNEEWFEGEKKYFWKSIMKKVSRQ